MKRIGIASAGALTLMMLVGAAERRAPAGWPLDAHGRPIRIVFVSRSPAADPGLVPGFGPRQRALVTRGFLMVATGFEPPTHVAAPRSIGGRPQFAFEPLDVTDPCISPDGQRLVFAATYDPDSGFRLFEWSSGFEPLPIPPAEHSGRYDDLDPCWIDEATLVFASTRGGWRSQYDGSPVTQLYRFDLRWRTLTRLTAERNGAEDPAVDPRTGRIVYTRWWFNRARADSMPGDTVNVWQAISIAPDGSDPRAVSLASGERRLSALYQPAIGRDGTLLGVTGDVLGLAPRPGALEVTSRSRANASPVHVAGARFDPEQTPRYGGTRGLAAPSACSPSPLPDGRVMFSLDPGGRGDFGVWVANRDGSNARRLFDIPGSLDLDATPWVSTPRPDRLSLAPSPPGELRSESAPSPAELERWPLRFRFTNRNVFGGGFGSREAAAARASGPVRIRFWAALPRPDAPYGDTLVLVREAPVSPRGRVDERDLPAGIPMFEQLIAANGQVLRSAHGPAHVAGYNAGLPGRTSSCVGCHRGHSTAR